MKNNKQNHGTMLGLYLWLPKKRKKGKNDYFVTLYLQTQQDIVRCKLELEGIGLDFITIDEFPWYFSLVAIKHSFNMPVV